MALNRVDNTSLALSFPYDTGRGVTTTVADSIAVTLTKQAYKLLYGYGHYSSTEEDGIIDSDECFAIIKGAATRICEELWQAIHKRRMMPETLFTDNEKAEILSLNPLVYYQVEDDDTLII